MNGRKINELNTATRLFPQDFLLVENVGVSRKATLQALFQFLVGSLAPGTRRSAKITIDNNGLIAGVENGLLTGGGVLDFPSISAGATEELTLEVSNAAVGDCVSVALPSAFPAGLVLAGAWVSATETVTIRLFNPTGAPIDPGALTFNVVVHKL